MELIVMFLCAMSGALIGTAVGILLMFRRVRPPSQAELDTLRGNLQTVEASLAAATAVAENLRKQIAERDRSIHDSGEELNEKQRQLGFAVAESEKAAAQVAEMAERRAELEARLEEEKHRVAEQSELSAEVARLTAQLGTERERNGQLTGQIAALQNERQSAAQGIEMLLMAQQNLSRFLKPVCEVAPNGAD